ncbi:MAG: FMN-binding negative transcriptional regulator [Bacteroidetes bacterium]|nr:FMN-binding negative transcriptional regulator [Bacteroidota bacterium]
MYAPKDFRNDDEVAVKEFIRQNSFGILVSQSEGKLWATHIPMLLADGDKKLSGHLAKGNKQWREFKNRAEVMAIFSGPHAYVSSSWYDHENVPTWNYISCHVYGNIRIIEGDELHQSLKTLVDKYEKNSECPISMEKFTPSFLTHELQGIVGFEIAITKIETAFKLSQNRDDKNYKEIISQLEKRKDENSKEVALAMKTNRKIN